jgi:protease-4
MAVKLVDHLGTLQDAIAEAGKLGGIKGEPKVIRAPKKRNSFLDLLIERSAGEFGSMMKKDKNFSINYEMQGMEE